VRSLSNECPRPCHAASASGPCLMNQGGEPAAVRMTMVSSLSVRAPERSPLSRATWVASLAIDALSVTLADARAELSIRFAS
jgi:hypothetical protein